MSESANGSPCAEPHGGRARVFAGGGVVHYRRVGCGQPVIVLSADPAHPDERIVDLLAQRFRVIRPDVDDLDGDAPARLRSFLEGLGAIGVGIVAVGTKGLAGAALKLARDETGHVSGVAVVRDQEAAGREVGKVEDAVDEGGARSVEGRASARALPVPTLVVERGDAPCVAAKLIAFLEGLADPAAAS